MTTDIIERAEKMDSNATAIEAVLGEFNVDARVDSITQGASVTRYELKLGNGVRVEKIGQLAKQIAYQTGAHSIRVLTPIPGKTAVGIELPAAHRRTVAFAEALAAIPSDAHPLTVTLGQTVDGDMVSMNLAEAPHLLVAGCTGSGKSSFINTALVSLLRRTTPEMVQLVLCDPKRVELLPYQNIAHLIRPVATETPEVVEALEWLVAEMENRYQAMSETGVRHIDGLQGYPYIVAVIDELADLVLSSKEIEPLIVRLTQKSRAAGIVLLLATQRPSVDVISGLMKANVPSRLAFAVQSQVNSRVILDAAGAEQLLGAGDALFAPVGARSALRVQGAFVSDAEVAAAVKEWTVKNVAASGQHQDNVRADVKPAIEVRMLDELIDYGSAAIGRVDDFLAMLNSGRVKRGDKMAVFFDSPIELSKAGIALDAIIRGLRDIKAGRRCGQLRRESIGF